MPNRHLLAIATTIFLLQTVSATSASAEAGVACVGTVCGLGGQMRMQQGDGLPNPISIAAAQGVTGTGGASVGPFTAITVQSAPATPNGLPLVGKGLGQPGQIKPVATATIMQTTSPGTGPRQLTLAPGVFHYGEEPESSLALARFILRTLAVQTNITIDVPHPGTTKSGAPAFTAMGAAIPTAAANVFYAGGRAGASTVSYYAGATTNGPGTPGNNFGNPSFVTPDFGFANSPPMNGVARFTRTRNQFGGQMIIRAMGTSKIYLNHARLYPISLPCKNGATAAEGTTARGFFVPFVNDVECQWALSNPDRTISNATVGIDGGAFAGFTSGSGYMTTSGVLTGTIGFNGTILGTLGPVTAVGAGIPVTGRSHLGVGMPWTTGMLTITVLHQAGASSEMFLRTGIDARDANGNGVVALVSGSMTARSITGGNANRTWITLEIPEPGAFMGASAAFFALIGCHWLVLRGS